MWDETTDPQKHLCIQTGEYEQRSRMQILSLTQMILINYDDNDLGMLHKENDRKCWNTITLFSNLLYIDRYNSIFVLTK